MIEVWTGGTDSGVFAVAGSHHKGYEVRPIEGAQSRVNKQKRGVGGWPGARKGGVGTPGPPLPSGSNLVVLPGSRARERGTRGGGVVKTLVGHAAPSGPRVNLMDGGGKWDSSVWKIVGRGRERRDDGRGDVSRFEGGRWVGRGGASALQLWAMHRTTRAVCKRRSDCDSPRTARGKSAGRAGRTMRF